MAQIFMAMDYLIMMSEKHLHFRKRQKHVAVEFFFSPRRSNWIHVHQKNFSNYVYLKYNVQNIERNWNNPGCIKVDNFRKSVRVHVYMGCSRTHELSTVSIRGAQSFNSWSILQFFLPVLQILDDLFPLMIKQVYNSLAVHDNSWPLKLDSFFWIYEALRTKIDTWLTPI